MYQVLLLSERHVKPSLLRSFPDLAVTQLREKDTLVGFFPGSSIDALLVTSGFEEHPVVSQLHVLMPQAALVSLGSCTLQSPFRYKDIAKALRHIPEICPKPKPAPFPFVSGTAFLHTLTNPVMATKLDEETLGLFPDHLFFACIAVASSHGESLFVHAYRTLLAQTHCCLGYRFGKNMALYVAYDDDRSSLEGVRDHLGALRYGRGEETSLSLFIGTIQSSLMGVYVSFFEAYETCFVNRYSLPCAKFEDISDMNYELKEPVRELEYEILGSMQYRKGRDVVPLVCRWFELYRAGGFPFRHVQCEAVRLYDDIKRVIFDHYVLKSRRIKRGEEVFEIINIPTFDALKTWFIVWLDYTLTDFAKARNTTPKFTIEDAYAFIDEHLLEDCSLANLADYFGLTPQYVSTLFHQEAGQTFLSYVTDRKMEKAGQMLLGHEKIYETARRLGYADSKYFRKLFCDHWHVGPQEYRKRHAGK